jgi:hypothetical protein
VVALDLVLARSAQAAVCISRLAAYPTGFEFQIVTISAPDDDELELDPFLFHNPGRRHGRVRPGEEMPREMLRFGVRFADGRKATNVGPWAYTDDAPESPVMHSGGGGGGGGNWRQDEWVWPLPPPGPLAFVCEWPEASIPLTQREIDAQLVLEAATRSQLIFSEDAFLPDSSGGSWSTFAVGTSQPIKEEPGEQSGSR